MPSNESLEKTTTYVMETALFKTTDVFEALAPEWNSLLHNSQADTPFLTHEWQRTWADCLCACEGELHLLTVRDGGALVGIAPLFLLEETDAQGRTRRLLRLSRRANACASSGGKNIAQFHSRNSRVLRARVGIFSR